MKLFGVVAASLVLASCVTASGTHKMAEKGGCADQDFVTHVSGADHCLAIEVWKSKEVFDGPVTLVVALHGDSGPGQFEGIFREMLVPNPEFKKTNTVLVTMTRPGYSGTNGRSSGLRPTKGSSSYSSDVLESVLSASVALARYYKADIVQGWGNSGGAAIWTAALGHRPDVVIPELKEVVAVACPCDLQQWVNDGEASFDAILHSVSAVNVAHKTPKHVRVIAITSEGDTNTRPKQAERYIAKLKDAGGNGDFILAKGGVHDSTRRSPEFRAVAKALLGMPGEAPFGISSRQ